MGDTQTWTVYVCEDCGTEYNSKAADQPCYVMGNCAGTIRPVTVCRVGSERAEVAAIVERHFRVYSGEAMNQLFSDLGFDLDQLNEWIEEGPTTEGTNDDS